MRDVAGLGLSLYNWLKREMSNYRKDSYEVERAGPTVYFRYQDKVILMGFESEKKGEREFTKFYVHSPDLLDDSHRAKVAHLIDRRLDSKSASKEDTWPLDRNEVRAYKKIFGDNLPHLMSRTIQFKREKTTTDYKGLSIIAPIISLEGKSGGLSDNIFVYGRKGLLAPVYAALDGK